MVRKIITTTYECEKCGERFEDETVAKEHEKKPVLNRKLTTPGLYALIGQSSLVGIVTEGRGLKFDPKSDKHVRYYSLDQYDIVSKEFRYNLPNIRLATEFGELTESEFEEVKRILPELYKEEAIRGKIIEE